jgi:hypothetical protein
MSILASEAGAFVEATALYASKDGAWVEVPLGGGGATAEWVERASIPPMATLEFTEEWLNGVTLPPEANFSWAVIDEGGEPFLQFKHDGFVWPANVTPPTLYLRHVLTTPDSQEALNTKVQLRYRFEVGTTEYLAYSYWPRIQVAVYGNEQPYPITLVGTSITSYGADVDDPKNMVTSEQFTGTQPLPPVRPGEHTYTVTYNPTYYSTYGTDYTYPAVDQRLSVRHLVLVLEESGGTPPGGEPVEIPVTLVAAVPQPTAPATHSPLPVGTVVGDRQYLTALSGSVPNSWQFGGIGTSLDTGTPFRVSKFGGLGRIEVSGVDVVMENPMNEAAIPVEYTPVEVGGSMQTVLYVVPQQKNASDEWATAGFSFKTFTGPDVDLGNGRVGRWYALATYIYFGVDGLGDAYRNPDLWPLSFTLPDISAELLFSGDVDADCRLYVYSNAPSWGQMSKPPFGALTEDRIMYDVSVNDGVRLFFEEG